MKIERKVRFIVLSSPPEKKRQIKQQSRVIDCCCGSTGRFAAGSTTSKYASYEVVGKKVPNLLLCVSPVCRQQVYPTKENKTTVGNAFLCTGLFTLSRARRNRGRESHGRDERLRFHKDPSQDHPAFPGKILQSKKKKDELD